MLTKIEVPVDYVPRVYSIWRADLKRFRWKYRLPDGQEFGCMTRYESRREAEAAAKRKERDLAQGLVNDGELRRMQGALGGPLAIASALDEYVQITSLEKTGETLNGEVAMLRASFRFFEEKLGLKLIDEVRPMHVETFRDRQLELVRAGKLKAISANNKLKGVRKVFRWLWSRKRIHLDPAASVEQIQVRESERARTTVLTQEQVLQILDAPYVCRSGFDVKAFFFLIYTTGLRPGEVKHLERTDIDWDRGCIHLRSKASCPTKYGIGWRPKWGKERTVPLHERALLLLRQLPERLSVGYVRGTPYPGRFLFVTRDKKRSRPGAPAWRRIDDYRASWQALLEAAGLYTPDRAELLSGRVPLKPHDVRRTWSAMAKQDGGFTVEESSRVLGHDPDVNVRHYREAENDERIREKMRRHPSNSELLAQHFLYAAGTEAVGSQKGEETTECNLRSIS